jgi:hypothetical protein
MDKSAALSADAQQKEIAKADAVHANADGGGGRVARGR